MENHSRSLSAKEQSALPTSANTDTKMGHDTIAPIEHDTDFDNLGSTHVIAGLSDSSASDINLDSATGHTELSPSRVLGKNVLKLGDYKLLRKLGEGAMGAVYKAVQVSFKRTVALKVLFPHIANNPKLVERLNREGRVMGQLDHPNIVQAYAIGEAAGCHYVAMEYVSGHSMQKWLAHLGCLSVGDAVRVALDCAKALAYAHAQNMVHRDIKPDNILVSRTGIVKVADLGMVKTHDEDMSLTQTGHAVGTPWYMPLEQARNSKEIDGRSDIYALGCTLYAMLTGRPPFVGSTIVDVIRAKEIGTFAPARQTNAHVPERLDLILAKMSAKLPKNRYQTCAELVVDLESLNLASASLAFVKQKPAAVDPAQNTPLPSATNVAASLVKSRADAELAEVSGPTLDTDVWYVRTKAATRKYNTAQLQKMLAEGTIEPSARASHSPNEGFRTLGTYKEFQGVALSKLGKTAADQNTARFRGLYKKLEEGERLREEKERADNKPQSTTQATTRYWLSIVLASLPIGLGLLAFVAFLWWLTR